MKNKNNKKIRKKIFRYKASNYYLDNNNALYYIKFNIKNYNKNNKEKPKIINNKNNAMKKDYIKKLILGKVKEDNNFTLMKIPYVNEFKILLHKYHTEGNHGGYYTMINKFKSDKIYIKGITYNIYNYINSCLQCTLIQNNRHKREPTIPIKTDHSKKRYIADITYLKDILGEKTEYPYLLVILDHFSKLYMAYPIKDKTSIKVLKKIKEFISYYGNPEEFGCDYRKEFSNKILKEYIESKSIKLIHGHPYNPKSQSSVERLH